jgi:hypothetical protein
MQMMGVIEMSLIERYIHEVGRRLPRRMRLDVEQELHSILGETLEQRAKQAGRQPDEDMEVAVLKEFGPPGKVALSYYPGVRHLVGPALFPTFLMVLRIVVIVVGSLAVLRFALDLVGTSGSLADVGRSFLLALATLWQSLISAFGTLVLVFAIIERVSPLREADAEKWDPRSLPAPQPPRTVKRGGLIVGSIFSVLLLVLFNFFPQHVGFVTTLGPNGVFVPILGDMLQSYVPLLNVMLLIALALNVVLLTQRQWNMGTRIVDWGLGLIVAIFFFRLLTGPSPFDFSALQAAQMDASLRSLIDIALRVAFAAGFGGAIAGLVVKTIAIIKSAALDDWALRLKL